MASGCRLMCASGVDGRRRARLHPASPAPIRVTSLVGVLAALLGLAGCGANTGDAGATDRVEAIASPDQGPALVPPGHVAVVRSDRTVARVDPTGRQVETLAQLPVDAGEPDAVAVSPDGRVVLVSAVRSDDDEPSICSAVVLQVISDGRMRPVADGAGLALSADGQQLAYFRYASVDGFCRRTRLVVRDLATAAESTVADPTDGLVGGTPPTWPVNWAPDGTEIAHVLDRGAVVTDVRTGATARASDVVAGRSLAPGWLPDGTLVVLEGCCIGSGSIRAAEGGREVFAVPGPVRSIRAARSGPGLWLTVEEGGLFRWDGATLRLVLADTLLSSG